MTKLVKTSIDAVLAGFMIAIGSIIYLNCSNKIVGAVLFSIGLTTIIKFKFSLYTGKVGFARGLKDIPQLLLIFVGNAVGGLFIYLFPTTGAEAIMANKLACPLIYVFGKAIVCGVLIYVCVAFSDFRVTAIAISAFILCGAEHSIADICFLFAANAFSIESLIFILVVALGNAVGALIPSLWTEKRDNELHKN